MDRIEALPPDEHLRLVSQIRKREAELGHEASIEQVADVLSRYGLVETKPIEANNRTKRRS